MSEAVSPSVQLDSIHKNFGAVTALDHVSLEFHPGRIHAILGENGAGKSTLLSVLFGLQQPDGGTIRLFGERVERLRPAEAMRRGVAYVQQHFSLVPAFTVLENLMLGREPSAWRLSKHAFRETVQDALQGFDLDLPWDERVGRLSVGVQQRVEIAKALSRRARILLFDEPTASLAPGEIVGCLQTIKTLRDQGATVVFVTHHLNEALQIADEITVLRNGQTTLHQISNGFDEAKIAAAIVGDHLPQETYELPPTAAPLLRVQSLSPRKKPAEPLSFDVHAGEILGVAGVSGNGQKQWIDLILGREAIASGELWLGQNEITHSSILERRRCGLAYIPQDRIHEGLLHERPLWENWMLNPRFEGANSHWLSVSALRRQTREGMEAFSVRAPSEFATPATLSGGHQQRFVLARELSASPKVIIAHDPARGLDIRAARFVHEQLIHACREGAGVLLLSSELSDLFLLCKRIGVISQGCLTSIHNADEWTAERLGRAMAGGGQ
ncbi:MAG: ATP-binding cassette domain-containing protein [Candidatus Hinthialibacter antarcticus]|nr:ATP-binding cassette domain-containing protein [Candidatus Hinthialibacter antarcticus]